MSSLSITDKERKNVKRRWLETEEKKINKFIYLYCYLIINILLQTFIHKSHKTVFILYKNNTLATVLLEYKSKKIIFNTRHSIRTIIVDTLNYKKGFWHLTKTENLRGAA